MKIDKKSMLLVVALLVCVIQAGFAGVMHFARGTVERDLSSERSNLRLLQARASELESEVPKPVKPVSDTLPKLLGGPDIVATLQAIQEYGDSTGVLFDNQEADPPMEVGRQRFTVTGRGTPAQVCAFVAALEQSERLIVVERGRLVPSTDFNVAFEIGLVTFYRSELK